MNREGSAWGADTVVIGNGKTAGDPHGGEPPRRRAPRRKGSAPASRRLALCGSVVLALAAVVVIVVGSGGANQPAAPIREVADPAPRGVVKSSAEVPTTSRRPGGSDRRTHPLKRQTNGKLERRERKPRASRTKHELAAAAAPKRGRKPAPAATPERTPKPAPAPTPEPAPEYVPAPEPEPASPTPPAVEFGM